MAPEQQTMDSTNKCAPTARKMITIPQNAWKRWCQGLAVGSFPRVAPRVKSPSFFWNEIGFAQQNQRQGRQVHFCGETFSFER